MQNLIRILLLTLMQIADPIQIRIQIRKPGVKKRASGVAKQEPNHEIENEDSRGCVPLRQSALYRLFKAFRPPHVGAKIHVFVYCPYLLVVKNTPPPLRSSLHASSPVFFYITSSWFFVNPRVTWTCRLLKRPTITHKLYIIEIIYCK